MKTLTRKELAGTSFNMGLSIMHGESRQVVRFGACQYATDTSATVIKDGGDIVLITESSLGDGSRPEHREVLVRPVWVGGWDADPEKEEDWLLL